MPPIPAVNRNSNSPINVADWHRSAPTPGLVGGPGKSNVWGSGEFAQRFHQRNDVVRVGYRGIDCHVELKCPEFTKALQIENPLSPEATATTRRALQTCNARSRAAGIDADRYNLAEVVEDIEAARKALGYERINFQAVSWGTQIAYTYAMRYPSRVHRMLLVGAGGRARGFDLWNPDVVDRLLGIYAERWAADSTAKARPADISATIRDVLATLPREWRAVPMDRDKIRLAMWEMLGDTSDVSQLFDAFAAAAKGDYRGLALLSWAYDDELRRELERRFGPYHGEFFSKTMSSGLDPKRDCVGDMEPPGTTIGSPAAKLLCGAASSGGWPIQVIPKSFRRGGNPPWIAGLSLTMPSPVPGQHFFISDTDFRHDDGSCASNKQWNVIVNSRCTQEHAMPTEAASGQVVSSEAEVMPVPRALPKDGGSVVLSALTHDFDSFYAIVLRYLLHRFFDRELAEELTAETFFRATGSAQLRRTEVAQVRVWLLGIATNVANTHLRRKRIRQFVFRRLAWLRPTAVEAIMTFESPGDERTTYVRETLLTMRPKDQTTVVLRYYCDLTFEDIAAVVDCRADAVRARLSRAIKELRRRLGSLAESVCRTPKREETTHV